LFKTINRLTNYIKQSTFNIGADRHFYWRSSSYNFHATT